MVLQRNGQLPKLPKDVVRPQIVAGVNALGRGSDRESLIQFITTIAQTMGPESIAKFIDPTEYIKRLATAQGIDVLNLVKSPATMQDEMMQAQQMQAQQSLVDQAGQFAGAPMMDPQKNPQAMEMMNGLTGQQGAPGPAGAGGQETLPPPQDQPQA